MKKIIYKYIYYNKIHERFIHEDVKYYMEIVKENEKNTWGINKIYIFLIIKFQANTLITKQIINSSYILTLSLLRTSTVDLHFS